MANLQETTYEVAIYWPGEHDYGTPDIARSMSEARRIAQNLARLGYSTTSSEIHIIKTVRAITVYKGVADKGAEDE